MSVISGAGQDWIGLPEDSVKKVIETECPDLNLSTNTVNKVYHYLKFEKSDGMQTTLVFLDDSNNCRYVKNMYDYVIWDRVIQDLNNKFSRRNDSLWISENKDKKIVSELKKEEWYFTVITKPVEKKK